MNEAFTYAHENVTTMAEQTEELPEEYAYMHEGGVSIIDGSRESRLLTGLALLAMSP